MPQTIAFRVDASLEIGSGHLMRCLTLADALSQAGHTCHFVSRADEGGFGGHAFHGLTYESEGGYGAHPKPPAHAAWLGGNWQDDAAATAEILATISPDWLVVDHYALDREWESAALPAGTKLMVIDDLADRAHMCNILLDQNLGRQGHDYDELVPDSCTRLIGPKFALLRPEFPRFRQRSLARRKNAPLAHILITMGGVDKDDVTSRVLEVLARCNLPEAAHITVVMGKNAPALVGVQAKASRMPCPTRVLVSIDNMAEIMASADLAIGAAGSTSWERGCLGLPTLMLTIADNQKEAALALESSGSAILLGDTRETGWENKLGSVLPQLGVSTLASLAANAFKLTHGTGSALVLAKMSNSHMQSYGTLRAISEQDLEMVLEWRNHPSVRENMYTQQVISLEEHQNWWMRMKENGDAKYLIFEANGVPSGFVSFVKFLPIQKTAEWGFYTSPQAAKGTGTLLGLCALDFAFKTLKLTALFAEVLDYNTSSLAFHKKIGFQESEHFTSHKEINGEVHHIYRLAITATQWQEIQPEILKKLSRRTPHV